MLATDDFRPRALIKNSNVKVVCTTDDPVSKLSYHKSLAKEEKDFKVLPALRPDHLISITDGHFAEYLMELSAVSGIKIKDFKTMIKALEQRFEFSQASVDVCLTTLFPLILLQKLKRGFRFYPSES